MAALSLPGRMLEKTDQAGVFMGSAMTQAVLLLVRNFMSALQLQTTSISPLLGHLAIVALLLPGWTTQKTDRVGVFMGSYLHCSKMPCSQQVTQLWGGLGTMFFLGQVVTKR